MLDQHLLALSATKVALNDHLPRCPGRKGRDYSLFLSKKTLSKRAKEKDNTFFAHDVVPRVLQALSIEDKHVVLVEGHLQLFC